MRLGQYLLAATMVTVMGSSSTWASTVYDAVSDFSLASNQGVNNVWSYGYETNPGGAFTLLGIGTDLSTVNDGAAFSALPAIEWKGDIGATLATFGYPGYNESFPFIRKITNNSTVTVFSSVQPPDFLHFHAAFPDIGSSATSAAPVLRFTAPASATYDLTGLFESLDPNINDDVALLLNDVVLSASNFTTAEAQLVLDRQITLTAGDRLDFYVGSGTDGTASGDSTGLRLRIAQVPEPASLTLLCVGIFMVSRRRLITS